MRTFVGNSKFLPVHAVNIIVNLEEPPMKAISTKIDALIKAHLALHVARTSPAIGSHRSQFAVKPEADVLRCQQELQATLETIFYPPSQ